jgi:hypothetical protein
MTAEEKVLDKIRKLNAHAESAKAIGSEAEAAAFAAMVNRLLNEHRLDMTDLEFEQKRETDPVDEGWLDWSVHGIRTKNKRIYWIEQLAVMVASAHCCRILVVPGSSLLKLVGTKTNREIAEYVIVTLFRSADNIAWKESLKYYEECKKSGRPREDGFRNSFRLAFVNRIAQRLQEEKDRVSANSTALVRYNSEAKDVEDYMSKFKKKSTAISTSVRFNREGVRRGRALADTINIKANAMNGGGETKKLN